MSCVLTYVSLLYSNGKANDEEEEKKAQMMKKMMMQKGQGEMVALMLQALQVSECIGGGR